MTPAAIIREAAAAGVSLALSPAGTIKAVGNQAAVDRWVPLLREHKTAILAALTPPDPLPPLAPASAARRQKVLAILARDGGRYATLVEDPNTDPMIAALATPDGTCELLIPKDRYDPFAVLAMVEGWNTAAETAAALWWRVAITEPGGRTVEVDTPSGWTLAEWQAYAGRYHGPGSAVTALLPLPKPRGHRSTAMKPCAPPARAWLASRRRCYAHRGPGHPPPGNRRARRGFPGR